MKRIIFILSISMLIFSCDIKKTEKAELPEVDVDVETEPGQLPEYDVDWADVNVGTRTETVKVPKVVIVMEEEEVEVPYIDVDMPNDNEKEEMTLMVEAEVTDKEHTIDIKEIIATDNNLYVIAELKSTDQTLGDKKMRVSDQVILNAPDLNVKYIIVGEKPDRVFNSRYKYVKNASDFKKTLENTKVIYTN
ncbi:MAG: hypothetical protein CL613_10425 [Aquimarina sp.]|nr:hypothetical protein [Aquimarina sp.]